MEGDETRTPPPSSSPLVVSCGGGGGEGQDDGCVLTSFPDSNGGSPPPRLASITDLLINQKTQKWNSNRDDQEALLHPNNEEPSPPSAKLPSNHEPVQGQVPPPPSLPPSVTRSIRFEDEGEPRRTASFGTVTSLMLNRRAAAAAAAAAAASSTADEKKAGGKLTESDLRRFVFQHSRSKRLVSGLRVHAFTRQAFISSFTVGLALGSLVAIALKILLDLACRMLYS